MTKYHIVNDVCTIFADLDIELDCDLLAYNSWIKCTDEKGHEVFINVHKINHIRKMD